MQNNAYAEQGFAVNVSALEGSGKINVEGYSGSGSGNAVTLTVIAPNGNVVAIDQLSPNADGEFSAVIGVGSLWSQDGTYSINLASGSAALYSASLDVDITNGVTTATDVSVDTVGLYGEDDGYETKMQSATPGSTGLSISADAIEGATSITINGAKQGDATAYQSSVEVDIADGVVVPEFGTIASLVLVVAITSIIILSAKGRLSIAPKL